MANKEFDIIGTFKGLCAKDQLLEMAEEAAAAGDQKALDEMKKMMEHMMKAAEAAEVDRLQKAVTCRVELLLESDMLTIDILGLFGIKITPSQEDGIIRAIQIRLEGASNEEMQKWVDELNKMIYTK